MIRASRSLAADSREVRADVSREHLPADATCSRLTETLPPWGNAQAICDFADWADDTAGPADSDYEDRSCLCRRRDAIPARIHGRFGPSLPMMRNVSPVTKFLDLPLSSVLADMPGGNADGKMPADASVRVHYHVKKSVLGPVADRV